MGDVKRIAVTIPDSDTQSITMARYFGAAHHGNAGNDLYHMTGCRADKFTRLRNAEFHVSSDFDPKRPLFSWRTNQLKLPLNVALMLADALVTVRQEAREDILKTRAA